MEKEIKPVRDYVIIYDFNELEKIREFIRKRLLQSLGNKITIKNIKKYPFVFPVCSPPDNVKEPPLLLHATLKWNKNSSLYNIEDFYNKLTN